MGMNVLLSCSFHQPLCTYIVLCMILFSVQLVLNPQVATISPKGMKLDSIVPHSLKGYFKTREELDDYEKTWHLYIYQPTWNGLKAKVSHCLSLTAARKFHSFLVCMYSEFFASLLLCVCMFYVTAIF